MAIVDPYEVKKSDFLDSSEFCGRSSSWGLAIVDPYEVKKSDFLEKSDFCGRSSSWGLAIVDLYEVKKSDFLEKSDFCGRSSSWGLAIVPVTAIQPNLSILMRLRTPTFWKSRSSAGDLVAGVLKSFPYPLIHRF